MRATLLYRHKLTFDDGAIIDIILWRLANPLYGCSHHFKYRLYFGYPGQRIVGYDNERGKGDQRHLQGEQIAYDFVSPSKLIDDFLADIKLWRQNQ